MKAKSPGILVGILVTIMLALPLSAVFYFGWRVANVPYPAFSLFDALSQMLPGDVLTFGIDTIVELIRTLQLGATDDTAKIIEQLMATGLFVTLAVVAGLVYFAVVRRVLQHTITLRRDSLISGVILGLAFGVPLAAFVFMRGNSSADPLMTIVWFIAVFALWGVLHGAVHFQLMGADNKAEMGEQPGAMVLDRRRFLVQLGGATATITVLGAGLGNLLGASSQSRPVSNGSVAIASDAVVSANLPNANDPLQAAPGTRPEYTPLDDHYRIDINTVPPEVDLTTYKLRIHGLVDNPVELTLDEIRNNWEAMNQFITMSCISNRVAGDLISTTMWTGVSMQRILELVSPTSTATHIKISAADGFDEVLALGVIRADERVMLAYAWDNEPLRVRHGSPLRIHIPDHYGMKQPKWITEMEFIDSWQEGYWVRRGWDREARVNATSVIDTVATEAIFESEGGQFVPIGGMAWAGARGISKVEVRVDEGEWMEARLRSPLSDKTWVIWRYDWAFQAGAHSFEVRCIEGDGATAQIEDVRGVRPSGATGIHSVNVTL